MKNLITTIMIALFATVITTSPSYAGSKERDLAAGLIIGTGALMLGASIADSWDDNHHRPQYRPAPHPPRPAWVHPPNRRHHRKGRYAYKKGHRRGYNKGYRHGYQDAQGETYRSIKIQPQPSGYWTKKKVWVEPVYESHFERGHMNRDRRWVGGRHVKVLVKPGYWEKQKVWVKNQHNEPPKPYSPHSQRNAYAYNGYGN